MKRIRKHPAIRPSGAAPGPAFPRELISCLGMMGGALITGIFSLVVVLLQMPQLPEWIAPSGATPTVVAAARQQIPTLPSFHAAATARPAPTATPPAPAPFGQAATPEASLGYFFETGTDGWEVNRETPVENELFHSTETVFSGAAALQWSPDGPAEAGAAEIFVEMESSPPLGLGDAAAPYDLTGHFIACQVYLSPELLANAGSAPELRMFAADVHGRRKAGPALPVNAQNTGAWRVLSVLVDDGGEPGFNSKKVSMIGVSFQGAGAQGSLWIDSCTMDI